MSDTEKAKKEYEIGVLIQREEEMPEVRRIMEQHGGEFAAEFQAKKIALAYPIKQKKEAVFAFTRFFAEPAETKRLEHDLQNTPVVLRSLITIPFKAVQLEISRVVKKRGPVNRPSVPVSTPAISPVHTLSNEALEKKIEEMLK